MSRRPKLQLVAGLLVGLTLAVGGGQVARADGAATATTSAVTSKRTTDVAMAEVARLERERGSLVTLRDAGARTYAEQLRAVDDLKRQRASWRRDRALREQLATSQAQAGTLAGLDGKIATVDAALRRARAVAVSAIDAETKLATGTRASELAALRRRVAPPATPTRRRIVLPDATIDPLADPEDLDAQAQLLRDAEAELGRAIASLDVQATTLRRTAGLRAQHDRAGELATRDDDGPRRTTGTSTGRSAEASSIGTPGSADGVGGLGDDFAGEAAAVVLRDVVDAATSDALRRADRSADPATKVDAAVRARSQAASRRAALAAQRAAIEARARELRAAK